MFLLVQWITTLFEYVAKLTLSGCIVNMVVLGVALAMDIFIGFLRELLSPLHRKHFHRVVVHRQWRRLCQWRDLMR